MTVFLERKSCDLSMYFMFIRKTILPNQMILHVLISHCIIEYPEKLPWWC